MEQQLLGYEDMMYRLDEAEHTAGQLDRVDRQSQTKWIVKLTWFHNTICGELEQDATEESLMRYTRGYIMQLIGGILFPDAFDSRVHIRWLPYWRTLTIVAGYRGARLCWHGCTARCAVPWIMVSAIWVGASACCCPGPITIFRCYGPMALILIGFHWLRGIYRPDNARGESKLRHYRSTLNVIEMLNVEWTPYADPQLIGLISPAIAEVVALVAVFCSLLCFAFIEWHQVDRVVRQFGGLQHILTRLLNIDEMHRLYGEVRWFPQLLGGSHELWDAQADHCLHIHHHIDLCPSLPYMSWYLQWAHTEFFGLSDQHLVARGPAHLPSTCSRSTSAR
ncbi:hypothetical protein Ahy_A09g043579 [Arachis hypogaea]|uniref:Aminotransferase-like plant mobile domain-containing protein n=1 Tax=Arachis hypogaea TaxID=3818 RepID=A0A445BIP9_ARAHY|nr:hypothetical protein Ahy_A09g043579 [Arachis hypogaea]